MMVVKLKARQTCLLEDKKFWILDFGFWIGWIAALYPFVLSQKTWYSGSCQRRSAKPWILRQAEAEWWNTGMLGIVEWDLFL